MLRYGIPTRHSKYWEYLRYRARLKALRVGAARKGKG